MKLKKLLVAIILIVTFISIIPVSAIGTWSYYGFEFINTDSATKEAIITDINNIIEDQIRPNSYFTGISPRVVYYKMKSSDDFNKLFVKYDVNKFRDCVMLIIKSKYTDMVLNERNYDWYYSQKNTGEWSAYNCSCACIAMVAKWYDPAFDKTVEQIRKEMGHTGATKNSQERKYYDQLDIKYDIINTDWADATVLLNALAENTIIDVTIDSQYAYCKPANRQKFHSIILNGYFKYNGEEYVTVYDPVGLRAHRTNNTKNIFQCDVQIVNKYKDYIVLKLDEFEPYIGKDSVTVFTYKDLVG